MEAFRLCFLQVYDEAKFMLHNSQSFSHINFYGDGLEIPSSP